MITREEAQRLSKIKPYKDLKRSYVKDIIIESAMVGHTALMLHSKLVTDEELDELIDLGYDIEGYKDKEIRIYWDL